MLMTLAQTAFYSNFYFPSVKYYANTVKIQVKKTFTLKLSKFNAYIGRNSKAVEETKSTMVK